MPRKDPLALFFDGRDLDRSLLGRSDAGEGRYEFTGWSVAFGTAATREQRLLVSVHETFHSILSDSTAFGSLLHVASYLYTNGWEVDQTRARLTALIGAVRTSQECYATYGSLFILGHGEPAVDLMTPYPDYVGFFQRAERALHGLDCAFVRQCGLNAVFRLCLQPEGLWQEANDVVSALDAVLLAESLHPDRRLDALLSRLDKVAWMHLVARMTECVQSEPQWPALEAHIRGESNYDDVSGTEFDDLERLVLRSLYDGLRVMLAGEGFRSLDFDGHQPLTQDMTAAVLQLVPPERAQRRLIPATSAHREVDFINELGEERFQIRIAHCSCLPGSAMTAHLLLWFAENSRRRICSLLPDMQNACSSSFKWRQNIVASRREAAMAAW